MAVAGLVEMLVEPYTRGCKEPMRITFVTDLLHIPSSLPGKLAQLNLTLLVKLKTSST